VPDNEIWTFSTKGEDTALIKDYLQRCEKRGDKKSKVIVSALKHWIAQKEEYRVEKTHPAHLKEMRQIWDDSDNAGGDWLRAVFSYLKSNEIDGGEQCIGCIRMHNYLKERQDKDEELFNYLYGILYPEQKQKEENSEQELQQRKEKLEQELQQIQQQQEAKAHNGHIGFDIVFLSNAEQIQHFKRLSKDCNKCQKELERLEEKEKQEQEKKAKVGEENHLQEKDTSKAISKDLPS
jgi:hypothetical protein